MDGGGTGHGKPGGKSRQKVNSVPASKGSSHVTAAFFLRTVRDIAAKKPARATRREHLDAAVEWLKRAHDVSPNEGVSDAFSLKHLFKGGWKPSYRETSGYIAKTFFRLAGKTGDSDAGERAVHIARWLAEVQNTDGSVSNPALHDTQGIVFDTGQVLHGFVRAFRETQDPLFLESSLKAGKWLASVIDGDGAWRRNTFNNCPHTYNTRTAWAMLELGAVTEAPGIVQAARRNLDWAKDQERDGWLDRCGFGEGELPFTHTIAYAIRGLLEAGLLLKEERYLSTAERCARALLNHVAEDGFIPARFDASGRPRARYCCLTGNCQLAIIWFKLFQVTGQSVFGEAASRSLDYVTSHHDVHARDPDIRGGVKGSHPLWGSYAGFSYPNWAAKFFIDALLLQEEAGV
jgi:hypothetical protein